MTDPAPAEAPPEHHVPLLHLAGFEGPLDLLLDLAERQRVDLTTMSVADLVTQFLAAMEKLAGCTPIERRAEWLLAAARLLQLRSRLLFPANPEEAAAAAQDAAAERARLKNLAQMRAAAAWLEGRPQLGQDVFSRIPSREQRPTGYVALLEACLAVRSGQAADAPLYRPATLNDLWQVEDALALIRSRISSRRQGAAFRHFLPDLAGAAPLRLRAAIASTLIASLELARTAEVGLDQDTPDAEIQIRAIAPNTP
jgi:segregation and condensation protein A